MAEIIKDRAIVNDDWCLLRLAEGQGAPDVALPDGRLIVPLSVWQQRRVDLEARLAAGALGVWLSDVEGPELIAADIGRFPLIAVDFPKFANGRGYSTAALLRDRYGFRGELRAIGDVLRDQIFYLARVGFDAFAPRPDRPIADVIAAFDDYSETYQGSVDNAEPLFRRARRASAG